MNPSPSDHTQTEMVSDSTKGLLALLILMGLVGLYVAVRNGVTLDFRSSPPDKAQPEPTPPVDPKPEPDRASLYFDRLETLWRTAHKKQAELLRAGAIKSEADATYWFSEAYAMARKEAAAPLLEWEYSQFGGERWTPELQAEVSEQYAEVLTND